MSEFFDCSNLLTEIHLTYHQTDFKLKEGREKRKMLIQQAASHIQHMQKALSQMNLQLYNVISDITGDTGMRIIQAIIAGERDPKKLATYRNHRCRNSLETIEKSL